MQLEAYWINVGAVSLALLNIYLLMVLWGRANQAWRDRPTKLIDDGKFRYYASPVMLTVFVAASFGMLALGRSPEAPTENLKLHGDASPSVEAVEAELRQERELHLSTKQELIEMREQWAEALKKAEKQQFDSDVKEGEEHMLERRRQLMERSKDE